MTTQKTHDHYTRSGAYKFTYLDCHKAYVGQTERGFVERFNDHKSAFKTNSHINFSDSNKMQILKYHGKCTHLNTIQRYYIYAEFIKNNHLNNEHNMSRNKIFVALLNPTSHKSPTT
jgi:hypothetical protein